MFKRIHFRGQNRQYRRYYHYGSSLHFNEQTHVQTNSKRNEYKQSALELKRHLRS